MAAAWNGSTGAATRLLDAGARVNEKDAEKQTALMKAAFQGHESIVETLLSHGAKVTEVNASGQSPLMLAAFKGHLMIVNALLQHETPLDLEVRDHNGQTALMLAVAAGHNNVVDLLISKGALEPGSLFLVRGYQAALDGRATNALEWLNRALEKAGELGGSTEWKFRVQDWSYSVANPKFVLPVLLIQCSRDAGNLPKAQEYAQQVEHQWPKDNSRQILYRRSLIFPEGDPRQVSEQYSAVLQDIQQAAVPGGEMKVLRARNESSPGRGKTSSGTVKGLIH
jgi:hypothetical protein